MIYIALCIDDNKYPNFTLANFLHFLELFIYCRIILDYSKGLDIFCFEMKLEVEQVNLESILTTWFSRYCSVCSLKIKGLTGCYLILLKIAVVIEDYPMPI